MSAPRAECVTEEGVGVPPAMGVATARIVQPTGGGRAAVIGDVVMTAAEVNPVIRTPREYSILVTAVHNHMLAESPRLCFRHC